MGQRKKRYYIKKRKTKEKTNTGRAIISQSNKLRKIIKPPKQKTYSQYTVKWQNRRNYTIPSSLIRRAVSGNPKFREYYEVNFSYSTGCAIEESILNIFKQSVKSGHQISSAKIPWLSATPDGFIRTTNIPVEIKTSVYRPITDIIKKHYHQLQFTMLNANCDHMFVFLYRINIDFNILRLKIDQDFIENCLPRLEFSYFRHMILDDNEIASAKTLKKITDLGLLKYVKDLNHVPTIIRKNKKIDYEYVTTDFMSILRKNDLESGRKKIIYTNDEDNTKQFNNLNRITYKYHKIEIEHRPEVQNFINLLFKLDIFEKSDSEQKLCAIND